jgi:hypothetical protein
VKIVSEHQAVARSRVLTVLQFCTRVMPVMPNSRTGRPLPVEVPRFWKVTLRMVTSEMAGPLLSGSCEPSRYSLPSAIASHNAVTLVSWISQTFLQLVLLSVIIVGQNVLAAAADKRSEATYNDADAVLHEAVMIQEHLVAQDKVLSVLIDKAQGMPG